tara:strand:+ start:344 stop:1246 length:903 start_codon:yes stop_codon:yes gene_type:complete
MSLSYTNTPVFIGVPDTDSVNTGFTGSMDYIPALRSDVSLNTSSEPKRNLGVDVNLNDQFRFGGSLSANITIESFIQGSGGGYTSIGEGFRYLSGTTEARQAYVPIQIGENLYKKCYPSEVSIRVEPYLPAIITANFVSLDPPTGTKISGKDPLASTALSLENYAIPIYSDDMVYGHTCSVSNMNEVVGAVQSQATFTRKYNRSPVYEIGSPNPSSMLLDGIEEELSITATGLNKFINLSGQLLAGSVEIGLQNEDNNFDVGSLVEIIKMPAGARVVDQSYGINGGDSVQTTVRLRNTPL